MVEAKPAANTDSTKSELPVVASPKTLPPVELFVELAPPTLEEELDEEPPPELLHE